jgi:hypothetical protein
MTELTTEYLDSVLERVTDDEIRETALSMKGKMVALDQEENLEKKRVLTESLMEEFALLRHLLDERSRGGEDFINDDVFHAQG